MRHIAANCPAQLPFNPAPVQSRPSAADRKNVSLPASGPRPGSGQAADEPLITALVSERCPSCGARLAAAAQWCGLCYADLRPAPAPSATATPPAPPARDAVPSPRPAAVAAPAATDPSTSDAIAPIAVQPAPAGGTARPTWPCASCGASVDVDLDACSACGTPFLGALRSASTGIELPVVGNLGRFSDRSRIVLGAAAGILIAFVLMVLTALLGR
jgi:hypothetical protein